LGGFLPGFGGLRLPFGRVAYPIDGLEPEDPVGGRLNGEAGERRPVFLWARTTNSSPSWGNQSALGLRPDPLPGLPQ